MLVLTWQILHPHVKVYFLIINDVFIFSCPVRALKQMCLLSSAKQGSDSLFIFSTLLGTQPLAYDQFTKYLKWLLKHLGQGTGYSSHS